MNKELKVSGGRIEVLVGHMADAHEEMTRILEALTTALNKLSGEWSGEAQDAYVRAQTDWLRNMGELDAELDRARRNTSLSNEAFTSAAKLVRRLWSES